MPLLKIGRFPAGKPGVSVSLQPDVLVMGRSDIVAIHDPVAKPKNRP